MSLPVLHSFAGYSLMKSTNIKEKEANQWSLVIFCVLLANFPDFDFIPGVFVQDAAAFHRGASHSLFAGFVIGPLAGYLYALWKKLPKFKMIILSTLCYASHLVLDLASKSPKGLQILWPFSTSTFHGPFTDYSLDIANSPLEQAEGLMSFIRAVFSSSCVNSMMIELLIVFGCWLVSKYVEMKSGLRYSQPALVPFVERRVSRSNSFMGALKEKINILFGVDY